MKVTRKAAWTKTMRLEFLRICLAIAVVLTCKLADAEPVSNRVAFTWSRTQSAESCPEQEVLAEEIRNVLGPQAIDPNSSRKVDAIVSKSNEIWRVAIYERVNLEPRFFREITNDAPDCGSISKSTLAILKILIDAGPTPRPPPPPCPICEEKAACAPCPKPSPWKTSLVARGAIRYGIFPDFAPDFGLFAGLSSKRWEISAGMSWMPEFRTDKGAALGMNTGWLGGCFHLRTSPNPAVSICAHGVAGVMHLYSVDENYADIETNSQRLWSGVAMSPRLRRSISWFVLEAGIDVIVPLYNPTLEMTERGNDGQYPVSVLPDTPLAASAYIGLGVSIP